MFLLHGGDLELSQWLILGLIWIVLPLGLLVFFSFRLGDYLRKRERRKQAESKREPNP
jgi:hypothetical protein